MEMESIISIIGLLLGGGSIGGFLFWRQSKRKAAAEAALAEAEARLKEAEAKKENIEADKEKQDYYQQLIQDLAADREDSKKQKDELRAERDHYKSERNEYRAALNKLTDEFREFRRKSEDEMESLKRTQARQGLQIVAMRPLLCGDSKCKKRVLVATLDVEELEKTVRPEKKKVKDDDGAPTVSEHRETAEIEPLDMKDM